MKFELDRIARLYQGAGKALGALGDHRCRRAAAVHGMVYAVWIRRWRRAGADPGAGDWVIGLGERIGGLTRGCLLAAGLTDPGALVLE